MTHQQATDPATEATLFAPMSIRGLKLPNRVGVSPMCMYNSTDGYVDDYHLVHLGRFALGGAGLVVVEATAVEQVGRISHHDLGIWSDEHVPGLARLADFLQRFDAVPGIQLGHAGRKASVRKPWHGGDPLDEGDAARGCPPWPVEGPSAVAAGPGWPVPTEMSVDDIARSVQAWQSAASRAVAAGFRFIELHGAHGYLLHSFQSPVSNQRDDEYGGSAAARMRYPLEVVRAVREVLPDDVALSYRLSAVDGMDGGLTIADTIEFARAIHEAGVDVVDTSSGGIVTDRSIDTRVRRGFAFHADFARELKQALDIPVATVGMVVDPAQAQLLVERGETDIVLLGREMLDDPQWAHHARRELGLEDFSHWHEESALALRARAGSLARLAESGETPLTRFGD